MRIFFALISVALVAEAVSGVGLAWDGSYALFNTLDSQVPIAYYGRLTHVPLHWIVVETSHFTTDLTILRIVFGIVYAGLTLFALAAAWWVVQKAARPQDVRHRGDAPRLFIWAALGIGIGTLPGQVCAVCQSLLIIQLFWPILLAVLLCMPRHAIPVVIVMSLAIFFFHPTAMALFALAFALCLLVGWRYRQARKKLWLCALAFAVVGALAAVRFFVFRTDYETEQLSLKVLQARFNESLAGLPILALAYAWFAALLILAEPPARRWGKLSSARAARYLQWVTLTIAGILLILWASDAQRWAEEVNFRAWVPFISLPFMLAAVVDALWTLRPAPPRASNASLDLEPANDLTHRRQLARLIAAIFFVVVTVQSFVWLNLTGRLDEVIQTSTMPCISASSIAWLKHTPLDHWSVTTLSLLLQNRMPSRVILNGNGCAEVDFAEGLLTAQFGPGDWNLHKWQGSWFDLSQLHTQLIAGQSQPPSCQYPFSSGWYGIERADSDWHRWMNGHAQVDVLVAHAIRARLSGEVVSIQQPNQVDVVVNGVTVSTLIVTKEGWQAFGPLTLELIGGKNVIEFISQNPPIRIESDSRELAVALGNLKLTTEDGVRVCM